MFLSLLLVVVLFLVLQVLMGMDYYVVTYKVRVHMFGW